MAELALPTSFQRETRSANRPGELEAVRNELPRARFEVLQGAGHGPHTAGSSVEECNRVAVDFLADFATKTLRLEDSRRG